MGGAFLKTLQVGLGDAYTPEVAAAFTAMWGVVEATMLEGVKEAEASKWGNYAKPESAEMEKAVEASISSARDWWQNPAPATRGC